MTTFKEFADQHDLLLTVTPERHRFDWNAKQYRYHCTLSRANMTEEAAPPFSFDYTMGCGLLERKKGREWIPASLPYTRRGMTVRDSQVFAANHRPRLPELDDVLCSLALDSSALDSCFEDWAEEYGYDTDSRSAEKTYRACIEAGLKLRALLGWSKFRELLNCEEE